MSEDAGASEVLEALLFTRSFLQQHSHAKAQGVQGVQGVRV